MDFCLLILGENNYLLWHTASTQGNVSAFLERVTVWKEKWSGCGCLMYSIFSFFHQLAQFSKWLHRTYWSIIPSWILWVIPFNQIYLPSIQSAQDKLFAVHMKALLCGTGLRLAPIWGFRGSLALLPGWRCCRGLQKGPRGLPEQVMFSEMCIFFLSQGVFLG